MCRVMCVFIVLSLQHLWRAFNVCRVTCVYVYYVVTVTCVCVYYVVTATSVERFSCMQTE